MTHPQVCLGHMFTANALRSFWCKRDGKLKSLEGIPRISTGIQTVMEIGLRHTMFKLVHPQICSKVFHGSFGSSPNFTRTGVWQRFVRCWESRQFWSSVMSKVWNLLFRICGLSKSIKWIPRIIRVFTNFQKHRFAKSWNSMRWLWSASRKWLIMGTYILSLIPSKVFHGLFGSSLFGCPHLAHGFRASVHTLESTLYYE